MNIYYKGKIYTGVIAAPLFPLDPQVAFVSEHEVIGKHSWKDKQEVKEGLDYKLSLNNVAIAIAQWKRYRFYTKSVDDYRPLIFNEKFPWWCSGQAADGSSATIIAYLPVSENLSKYWDDAFDVDFTLEDEIKFSDRFPKPSYYKAE